MTDNTPSPLESTSDVTWSTALSRGFALKCPHCGVGKLLHGYISPNKCCSSCSLDFEPLRADDGPAWITILLTGHIVMPFAFILLEDDTRSVTTVILILIALVLFFSALILPRAKGVFMSIIWLTQSKKIKPHSGT